MFAFYKVIKILILPPTSILLLLLAGFVLVLMGPKRLGKILLGLSIALFYLLSIGPTANLLLHPLESNHTTLSAELIPRVGTIVVLGGGASATANLPVSSRLSNQSTMRLLEGVRLYNLMDQPQIVVSGGSGNPFVQVSEAVIMREFLLSMGIPGKQIITEIASRDTYENARGIQRLHLRRPLILVTSAAHMPRSLKVFRALGMEPLPAPCNFEGQWSVYDPLRFFPSTHSLASSGAAIYEYLGTWWYDLTGRI